MKRFLAFLCSGLLMLQLAGTALAAPQGATSYRDTIGSGTANLVTIAMPKGRTGKILLSGSSVVQDENAASLVTAQQQQGNLVAAINGGFFNAYYSTGKAQSYPDNCPQIYNTVIVEGKVVNAGGYKPVLGFTADGAAMIDKVGFRTMIKLGNGFSAGTWGVNYLYTEPDATMLFTDELTLPVAVPQDSTMVFIKDGKVEKITGGGSLTVPQGTDVLVYNSAVALLEQGYNRFPKVGESAVIYYNAEPRNKENTAQWNNMRTVLGGGSILLLDGWVATDQNPEFTEGKQQPDVVAARSFVAVTYNGSLLMGTANASFNQIAAYLKTQGVKDAMALDGGASSMLYVEGSGYLTKAGRKLPSVLAIVDETTGSQTPIRPDGVDTPMTTDDGKTPSSWAQAGVQRAIDLNIAPENMREQYRWGITRGEFCALAVRFLQQASGKKLWELTDGKTLPSFTDTTDGNITGCAALGIVQGRGQGKFDPEGRITRAEAAVILTNTAKALGKETAAPAASFGDMASIPSWATASVNYVAAKGVMQGDGTNFNHNQGYTREQAIVTVMKLLDVVK